MFAKCSCPIQPNMTYSQLREIITSKQMCTHSLYICPHLDRELRRADAERMRRSYYDQRLRKQGFSQEEIDKMPRRKRGSGRSFEQAEVSFDF